MEMVKPLLDFINKIPKMMGMCGVDSRGLDIVQKLRMVILEWNNYKNLEEQGLLLKLPCKVGDTVYITDGSSLTVREIHIQDNLVKYFVARFNPNGLDVRFPFDNIGKTVFLTQAEAEEVLKRMEREE